MVQQTLDSKVSEYGLCNPESSSPSTVSVKKTPMTDLQSGNRKDLHLVYVRRKSGAESGKSNTYGGISTTNSNSSHSRQVANPEETNRSKNQIEEPNVSCFPAFSLLPNAPLTISSEKASVLLSVGKSGMMLLPLEFNHNPVASATPLLNSPKESKKLHWEERYFQLQMLLNRLDQSSRDDYVQMLRSLSSVELSRLAVELEKKSIQLSLEEAKEMQRLALLNLFGKPLKNV